MATNFVTSNQFAVYTNIALTNFATSNQLWVTSNYFSTNAVLSNAFVTYTNFVLTNFTTSNQFAVYTNAVKLQYQAGSANLTNFSALTTNDFHRVAAGTAITMTTNNGTVTVNSTASGGASALTTNVTVAYTGTTNLIIDFLAAPCYGTNSQGDYHITLTEASSYLIFTNMPGSPTNWIGNIHIKQDGTGNRLVFFKTNSVFFPSGVSPTITTTANAVDVLTFVKSINLTNVNCTYAQDFR